MGMKSECLLCVPAGVALAFFMAASGVTAQQYQPDAETIYQARKLKFSDSQKRVWSSTSGKTLEGVLDWADDRQAAITGTQRFLVPLASLSPDDLKQIDRVRAGFQPEQQALDALGGTWRNDPGALTKHIYERLRLLPKPDADGGIPGFNQLTGAGTQMVSLGTERKIGYADAERGFAVWTPAPQGVRSVLRPLLGEVVTFEMTYTGSVQIKGNDEPLGNLRQTRFDPDRITVAARGKVPAGLELAFTEAQGLRAILASESGKGLFTGPYPLVELDVTCPDRRASFWKSLKRGQRVKWSGVITGAYGGAVRGFQDLKYWWCVISIQDAGPVK